MSQARSRVQSFGVELTQLEKEGLICTSSTTLYSTSLTGKHSQAVEIYWSYNVHDYHHEILLICLAFDTTDDSRQYYCRGFPIRPDERRTSYATDATHSEVNIFDTPTS
jgi:hypothetical protein